MTRSAASISEEPEIQRSPELESWRLLPFSRAASTRHVLLSDALVRLATVPTVWWHAANAPTLLLGAGQASPGEVTPPAAIARRHSGGTAVLATERVIGLDMLLPRGHRLAIADVVEAYKWLGECWVVAFQRLGLPARVVSVGEARTAPDPPENLASAVRLACFGTLSPYEVVAGQHKLVGLSQVRRRNVLLQSGVHLTFDADALAAGLAPFDAAALAAELRKRATGLAELGRPDLSAEDLASAFAWALSSEQNVRLVPGPWTEDELAHAERGG